ncbi:MAG: pilus assembly protein PilM [bacterium]
MFKKNSVGIDIAERTVEVAELCGSKENPKILNIGRVEFESGIVSRGRIKKKARLVEVIKEALSSAKPGPVMGKSVVFGLPESQACIRVFQFKNCNREQLKYFIQSKVKKNIPIPQEDLVYSYKILDGGEDYIDVLVAAANKRVLNEWLDLFKELKLDLKIFDIEALAIFRGLAAKKEEQPLGIIDLGASTANISIFDKNKLRHSRIVFIAGDEITKDIANKYQLGFREAEERKANADLSAMNQLSAMILQTLDLIAEETKNTFEHWSDSSGKKIEEVLLVGGTAKFNGIAEYFTRKLSIKTKIITEKGASFLHVEAIGLAMRGLDDNVEGDEPFIPMPVPRVKKLNKNTHIKESIRSEEVKFKIILVLLIIISGAFLLGFSIFYKSKINLQEEMYKKIENLNL